MSKTNSIEYYISDKYPPNTKLKETGPNSKENSYPANPTNKTAPSVSNPNLNRPKWLRDYGERLLDEGEDRKLLIQHGALDLSRSG